MGIINGSVYLPKGVKIDIPDFVDGLVAVFREAWAFAMLFKLRERLVKIETRIVYVADPKSKPVTKVFEWKPPTADLEEEVILDPFKQASRPVHTEQILPPPEPEPSNSASSQANTLL